MRLFTIVRSSNETLPEFGKLTYTNPSTPTAPIFYPRGSIKKKDKIIACFIFYMMQHN